MSRPKMVILWIKQQTALTACADFPTGVEVADDTTALLIYCHACHAHIRLLIFCLVTQQTTTFWVWGTRLGPMTPIFELGRDFCTMHLTAKFHHPTFNRS